MDEEAAIMIRYNSTKNNNINMKLKIVSMRTYEMFDKNSGHGQRKYINMQTITIHA